MTKSKTRNKFEGKIEKSLKKSKVPFKYEAERIPYILCRHYIPDFIINTPTGKIYLEAKGQLRRDDRSKMVAVKKQHPEKDIRIIFYAHNAKYIRWAERAGFRYAIGTIPKEWFNGF